MRIGFDAKRAFHNLSGLGNYSRNVINQLAELYSDNEYFLYNPKEGIKIYGFPPERAVIRRPGNYFHKILPFLWRSWNLPKIIEDDRLDIFHGLSNELPFRIHKSSVRKVVSIHDLIFMVYPDLYKSADRLIYRKKFSYSAKTADIIIAVSEFTKKDIVKYFEIEPSRIEVIYQDCAPVFYNENHLSQKHGTGNKYNLPEGYVLYVGTIEKRKNLLSIIRAMDLHNIDLPLVVAGRSTSYKKEVMKYISGNKVKNIKFIEYVFQEDLPSLYRNAAVFVYPSSYEGFGIPVLESLNSGTPVITSRDTCLEETGGEAGFYIDPLDIDELGAGIIKVLDDSGLRQKMIKEGKKHALKFRPEITTRQLFRIYERLLS